MCVCGGGGGGGVGGGRGGRWRFHAGIAQWLERRTRDRKVANLVAGVAGKCSSPGSTFCADFILVSVPSLCYRSSTSKDLKHSAKSASGRLHLNTQSPYVCGFE